MADSPRSEIGGISLPLQSMSPQPQSSRGTTSSSSSSGSPRRGSGKNQQTTPRTKIQLKTGDIKFPNLSVLMLGESAVGKTTIVNSYYKRDGKGYKESTKSTTTPEPHCQYFQVDLDKPTITQEAALAASTAAATRQDPRKALIGFYLYDTAGQERFSTAMDQFYRMAKYAILCIDTKDQQTLDRAVEYWIPRFTRQNTSARIVVALTKTDQFHLTEEKEARKAEFDKKYAGAGVRPEMVRLTPEIVYEQLKKVHPGLEQQDIFKVSGRHGFNIRALFLRLLEIHISATPEAPFAKPPTKYSNNDKTEMRAAVHRRFLDEYCEDWGVFNSVTTARQRFVERGQEVPAQLADKGMHKPELPPTPPPSSDTLYAVPSASPRPGFGDSSGTMEISNQHSPMVPRRVQVEGDDDNDKPAPGMVRVRDGQKSAGGIGAQGGCAC